MNTFLLFLIIGFIGFVIGGFFGVFCFSGWSPSCWIGLSIGMVCSSAAI